VSQFEDTRVFGPANSFVFTIDEQSGSFMRGGGPSPDQALGEWHMHCHVLDHMMMGMMGSLLVVRGGEPAGNLPVGRPMSMTTTPPGGGQPGEHTVHITTAFQFDPETIEVMAGDTVTWQWDHANRHSVTSDTGVWDSGFKDGTPFPSFPFTFTNTGTFPYHCNVHPEMTGTVKVKPMSM
jgi:plastocyanin